MGQHIYITACDLLCSGKKIILVKTIRRSGSTPRDIGSMCIVTQDNQLIGTVGGGLLEHKAQQQAMSLFEKGTSEIYRFKMSNDDLAKNGMICGGDVDLFLEPLYPSDTHTVAFFKAIKELLKNNQPAIFFTKIADNLSHFDDKTRLLLPEDGKAIGSLPDVTLNDIDTQSDMPFQLVETKKAPLFIEKLSLNPRIFLFGAGHVSIFVAQLAKFVGFDITVIDDRQQFANKDRFPDADDIRVTDFKTVFDSLNISTNAYILIITRGHLHDKTVLEFALKTNAAYIGMIGSTKKRDIIYKGLMEDGVSKKRLGQVHAPIGTDIRAETPEEIAVSIVGELIKKRAPAKKQRNMIL